MRIVVHVQMYIHDRCDTSSLTCIRCASRPLWRIFLIPRFLNAAPLLHMCVYVVRLAPEGPTKAPDRQDCPRVRVHAAYDYGYIQPLSNCQLVPVTSQLRTQNVTGSYSYAIPGAS